MRDKEKEEEFLKAIQNNQIDHLKNLIHHVNLHCENDKGLNGLFIASSNNNIEIIKFLLSKGFEIGSKTKWGENALFFAAEKGNYRTLKYLIENGLKYAINYTDIKGNSIIHYAAMSDLSSFLYLLSLGANPFLKGNLDRQCLHFAAIGGKMDVLNYLLENFNGIDINSKDKLEMNCFHLATENGNIETMKYLIQKGISYKSDIKYQTNALFIATRSEKLNVIEYLLSIGFDLNRENKYGSKVIHIAATDESIDLVKYYIKKGIDVNCTNLYLQTPLSLSITQFDLVNFLIKSGADIYRKYPYDRSILHIAKLKKGKSQTNDDVCNLIILKSLEISDRDDDDRNIKYDQTNKEIWKSNFIGGSITHETKLMMMKDEFGLLPSDYSSLHFHSSPL